MKRQLELRIDRDWGGRRFGAGRKPGPRPLVRHRSRERFANSAPVHVTLKVRSDVPSLRSLQLVREIERVFANGCERREARLVHYSLQTNHAHLIVEAKGPDALGRLMKSLGARFGKAVNRVFGRRGPVLLERYHMRALRTPREVRNALAYVLLNARRHSPRPPTVRRVDPASSGRWFHGWRDGVPGSKTRRAVADARTWLLRTGWRRHGLIDLSEVPGTR